MPIADRAWWDKIPLKLSVSALKEANVALIQNKCALQVRATAGINIEYRRQRWLGDSKEAHQVVLI